jgi:hypothetical protein
MSAAPVINMVISRESADCALVALAMYTGASYEDVLRVATVTDRKQGRNGLWRKTMIRIAKRLGHALKVRNTIDWESDYGLLHLPGHAAVLRNGLVIEYDGTIWDADDFLAKWKVEPRDCQILVCDE